MLPAFLKEHIKQHLKRVKALHMQDLEEGFGSVYLPYALAKKYPNANIAWGWQYVFPGVKRSIDPRSGVERRHHASEAVLQRAVKNPLDLLLSEILIYSFGSFLIFLGYDSSFSNCFFLFMYLKVSRKLR